MTHSLTIFTWITIGCWILFCSYWLLLRNKTKENIKVRTAKERFMGALGYFLIFSSLYAPLLMTGGIGRRILPADVVLQTAGVVLCITGILICIWSRYLLGKNWSGGVTAKKDHELVMTGPYRFVRHPIYTGFITAVTGTTLVTGGLAAIIMTLIFALGLCIKINQEEILLSNLFPEAYTAYQQHTRKLIPFIW
ncbi:methyltransferase family protein [Chitinophaga solisilvae]|uniref:Isoprenylcysteine carboxylmethyltransferase family protein n=1 Tax=Chitinophaga solisilvae TaxID=1233460 RepID=A0A3S1DNY1_9BACT|nr:isoprenylcysteine carboxylmethyltransferase family protein [Chitinophaga solisilvae]NSL87849.1 isoprenylcysteine carboxylmethyltransferase family protein [Chitinophaga solisilvae]